MSQDNNSGCAVALIVIGALILLPSGLCTGVFALGPLVEMLVNPGSSSAPFDMLPLALIIGGPFVVGGGAMLWIGIVKLRAGNRDGG